MLTSGTARSVEELGTRSSASRSFGRLRMTPVPAVGIGGATRARWRPLDKPTEVPNQTDERGEERDLRGTVATHVFEFGTATLRVRQRREKPPLRVLVRVRQVSNEIGPRMRQRLRLSQAVGDDLELG